MKLEELGLTVDDYLHYIRGVEIEPEKERLIEEHWSDLEIYGKK